MYFTYAQNEYEYCSKQEFSHCIYWCLCYECETFTCLCVLFWEYL